MQQRSCLLFPREFAELQVEKCLQTIKLKKEYAILSIYMWCVQLHKIFKYSYSRNTDVIYVPSFNLTGQSFRNFIFIFIYQKHGFANPFFFCLLCFILAFKKILSVVIIIFNCSEIEKWDSTDRFLRRMSFWNILDDNILSCKWDFNWCNDLLSYSFHWLKQMACSTQQKWELVN